jgi:hypothetical protein
MTALAVRAALAGTMYLDRFEWFLERYGVGSETAGGERERVAALPEDGGAPRLA